MAGAYGLRLWLLVNLKKRWLHAIRRDEGKEFSVNQNKKICSRHLGILLSIGGQRIYAREGVVPSRFSCMVTKFSAKEKAS